MRRFIILVGILSLSAYGYRNYSASGSSVELIDGAIVPEQWGEDLYLFARQ